MRDGLPRAFGRGLHLLLALAAAALVIFVASAGLGPLPALGPALDPGRGIWTSAADAATEVPQVSHLSGLQGRVTVAFDAQGTPHIAADSERDAMQVLGYLQAKDRLFEMDLERRQAEGQLSAIVGPAALSSDQFQLDLGLLRTATDEWRQLPPGEARTDVLAFTAGVNQRIDQDRDSGDWPLLVDMLGYQPARWRPVDTVIILGILNEDLSYSTEPLVRAQLAGTLGMQRTEAWLPVLPPNPQVPYDARSHQDQGAAPIPELGAVGDVETQAVTAALETVQPLLVGTRTLGASNNWAVNGPKSATGGALMENDPHLSLTLPSIWYPVSMTAPGLQVSGVTIPGEPLVPIGENAHISWGATDGQELTTYYYQEETSAQHPGDYYWDRQWIPFKTVTYQIAVKGSAPVTDTVRISVHGPVITQMGETLAVDWVANTPDPRAFDALLGIMHAADWQQFTSSLDLWGGPIQNWIYADDQDDIGIYSPGYYPVLESGDPFLPLSGTGAEDVIGTIPLSQVPSVYDPPDHIVWSANQRPVPDDYPYPLGTTLDFDPGYRAQTIEEALSRPGSLTVQDFENLELDTQDQLAVQMLPYLLAATSGQVGGEAAAARKLLVGWDGRMDAGSAAATIWDQFWTDYLSATFGPWWNQAQASHRTSILTLSAPLSQDLQAWTASDPDNSAFDLPEGPARSAPEVMRTAFAAAVRRLSRRLAGSPGSWQWGRVHTREITSLAGFASLGYGPVRAGGDGYTPNAAPAGPDSPSSAGPSWRMIVDWGDGGTMYAAYPGGASENPASPHYDDRVQGWLRGTYLAFPRTERAAAGNARSSLWTVSP